MTNHSSSQPQGVRLEVRGVDKRYGARSVLHKADLVIEPGEFVAIVGRSGCGKSTLLRLVAGLESVSGGTIRIDGDSVSGLSESTRIMFQDSRLLPWKRVQDNVALGLPPERRGAAADVLARVGLGDRLNEWPARLSGGQRQRVALARALVAQPRALLLDEPFAALDPALRVSLRGELDALQRRLQVPMILITHDPQDAQVFGDQLLQLRDGVIDSGEQALGTAALAA